jgi:anthranilate/para-aminobenzoate synthase component II
MAVQHTSEPHFGVQFHPESILTPQGDQLLAQFLLLSGEPTTAL